MLPEIIEPEVAAALREHREDRERLLDHLTASLLRDARVRAAWLWGSFGRGEADDLSDLDPWIVVDDAFVGEMGHALRHYAQQTENFLSGGEAPHNGPLGGGFFSSLHAGRHGLLHLDCYWQPLSAVEAIQERTVLFDRRQKPITEADLERPAPESFVLRSEEESRIEGGIDFAWLMLSITAKHLARNADSDLSLMRYMRPGLEEAATLLGQEGCLEPSDWETPEGIATKLARLRRLVAKTARLAELAASRDILFSPRYADCLFRYLDLVEGILA